MFILAIHHFSFHFADVNRVEAQSFNAWGNIYFVVVANAIFFLRHLPVQI